MNQEQDKGSAKESAKKVDARDSDTSRSGQVPQQQQENSAQDQGGAPSPQQQGGGSDLPDHKVKEDLHRSVRKD